MKHNIFIKLSVFLFVALAGASNGVMDTLQFHYTQSVFAETTHQEYWNPQISWKNKYKDYDNGNREAAFPLSKTALVFATDGWHMFQFLMLSFFTLAIVAGLTMQGLLEVKWWIILIDFIVLKLVFSSGFHLMYSWVLV